MKSIPLSIGVLVFAAITAAYGQDKASATDATTNTPPKEPSFFSLDGTDLKIGSLPPVTFHGFASQGYLLSSEYNYLGKTSGGGTFQFNEFGLNASISPFPHLRITAQAFSYDLGQFGNNDPLLDYALADYTFCDELGVRVGRIRRSWGIYTQILDVDVARTSVILPQGLYDARWRDFMGSVDGGSVYGNFNMGKAGGLSYEASAGMINLSQKGGLVQKVGDLYREGGLTFDSADDCVLAGSQLWYNTPIEGLRAGVALGEAFGIQYNYHLGPQYGPYAGMTGKNKADTMLSQYSLEYIWKAWTFQTEYRTYNNCDTITGVGAGHTRDRSEAWYASAAYRFNSWFEVGSYYTQDYEDVRHEGDPTQYQKDTALTLRFDPKPWWIIKIEGHAIDGIGLLDNDALNPGGLHNKNWYMLAVKSTFSF